jgi:ketosteroid isomerase-like protein
MEDTPSESATFRATTPSVPECAELEQVQQQLIAAWIHRDHSALERLLAEEWSMTHTDGRMSTRDEVLRDLDTGVNRLLEGGVDDLRFRVYKDFAVVTGRTRARGEYKRHSYDVRLRFTDVLVRRDGRWQVVASHASRLASEEPAVNKGR